MDSVVGGWIEMKKTEVGETRKLILGHNHQEGVWNPPSLTNLSPLTTMKWKELSMRNILSENILFCDWSFVSQSIRRLWSVTKATTFDPGSSAE